MKRPDPVAVRTCWEFYAVLEGSAAPFFSGEPSIPMKNGFFWLIRPGVSYCWKTGSQPVRRIVFHFTNVPDLLKTTLGDRNFLFHEINDHDRKIITGLADLLMPYYLNPTNLLEIYAQKALMDLSLLFLEGVELRRTRPLHRREFERVRMAEEWYQLHMKSRPTIDHVASETGVSTSQLRRDFQTIYKLPPQIIFRRLRLYEATTLLSSTDWTLDQVCSESGFASKVDFHRTFKEEYKISPHQWRRKISV